MTVIFRLMTIFRSCDKCKQSFIYRAALQCGKKESGIYKIRYTATSDNSSGLLDQPVMKSKALYNSLKDIRLQNEKEKDPEGVCMYAT